MESESKRILVVDDDRQVRRYLCHLLDDAGFAIAAADSGPAALERIRHVPPDLVSLDLVMPGMDGWAVLKRLGALVASPPVLVLTGRIEEQDDQPLPPPAVGLVNKADDPRLLVEACRRILAGPMSENVEAPVAERRRAQRRPFVIPVRVSTLAGVTLAEGQFVRLSPIGAALEVETPLSLETVVRLWVPLPGRDERVAVDGQLHPRGTQGGTCVYGVSFMNLASDAQRRLERMLES